MRNFNLRELQECELEILKEFVRICKKHNLTYYLAWGTLLGAVRHQGFIPWDDDIDVCMPYDDYCKFKEVSKTELSQEYYYQDWEKEKEFFLPWAKLRKNETTCMTRSESNLKIHWGVGIDIFPLIKMDEEKCSISKKMAKYILFFIVQRAYVSTKRVSLTKKIKNLIYVLIPKNWDAAIVNYCMQIMNKVKKDERYYWDWDMDMSHDECCFPKEIFGVGKEYLFEDVMLNCPKDSRAYLKRVYGDDYMVVPEVKDRVDHGDIIVDLEKDYSYYQNMKEL